MEEWLRCNTCFRRMKNSSCVFYLTGCDHVFCSYCIDGVSKQCPKCDTVGAGIIPVRERSSQQTMGGLESVSSHTKLLIERPQFCRVQYLILSRYAEEKDKAYVKLVNFTDQLIVSAKLSAVSQKRLKKYHSKYRHLSTDDAPPTKNERNVPITAKSTSDILSNNARSQVCGSRELPQKSNHDRPQLDVPKSEYFPKNAHRNGTEVPQTSIYDYPQPVERKSEYFPKNSQFQLKGLKKYHTEYRHLSTDDAPPTTNERNVPMTAKSTSDILSNNAWSQVGGSRELPEKTNHDRPQLGVPKSEHFPKNAYRNGTEVPQT